MRSRWSIPTIGLASAIVWSLSGCRKDDPTHGRLEHTISELRTITDGTGWETERRNARIAGLLRLKDSRFDRPHIVYACRLPHRGPGFTFVVDYVDVQPRAKVFRVYGKSGRLIDLEEEESSRRLNLLAAGKSVLYSAVWIFDTADAPGFGFEQEASVEIYNPDGSVSPRTQIRMLPFQESLPSKTTTGMAEDRS